ncbi:hypothetical protein HOF92_03865, partial [bacterium]|nr:hypothetical protein [bacterium]
MGIFLEKLDQDLQAPDQELKTLALLKILRLESTFIEDSEYVDQLIQTLRRVFYHQDDQSARLSILGMVRLEGILPEQPQSEERREEALTVLRDPKASTQATLKALWTLVVQAKPEDIFLCAS